ncbi:MAG: hypothetical protein IJ713_09005 [Oscillibacter sp.]|nr:hypothetical protein [Oscillibacter sp.]
MMQYVWRKPESAEIDEPTEVYSELDEQRREVRRVEVYPNGQMFAYGGDRGGDEALSPDPFPTDLSRLPGKAYPVPAAMFREAWMVSQELPDGFTGMFM